MVTQKIYQLIAGYEADDCADSLINEPLFCQLLGKNALASQPSLARLNKRFNEDSFKSFEYLHWNLMDRIYTFDKPKQVILDIDSTHFSTYGNQEDTAFNYHYKATGYHPLMVFDGLTGVIYLKPIFDQVMSIHRQMYVSLSNLLSRGMKKITVAQNFSYVVIVVLLSRNFMIY